MRTCPYHCFVRHYLNRVVDAAVGGGIAVADSDLEVVQELSVASAELADAAAAAAAAG